MLRAKGGASQHGVILLRRRKSSIEKTSTGIMMRGAFSGVEEAWTKTASQKEAVFEAALRYTEVRSQTCDIEALFCERIMRYIGRGTSPYSPGTVIGDLEQACNVDLEGLRLKPYQCAYSASYSTLRKTCETSRASSCGIHQ